jgi:hypothetical protein
MCYNAPSNIKAVGIIYEKYEIKHWSDSRLDNLL